MKTKCLLTALMLFIILSISSSIKVYGMEIDRAIMHTDHPKEQLVATHEFGEALHERKEDKEISASENSQPGVHVVQKGDTLYRIALNHGVQVEELMEWNHLSGTIIYPGDKIVLGGNAQAKKTNSTSSVEEKAASVKKVVQKEEGSDKGSSNEEIVMNATAYTAYCEGCSGTTATGINLRSNPDQKVIAVDPNVIPLGSKVWVEGYGEAIAGDTGGAIKGHKIDVFIPTKQQALQWGRKQVKVRILN